MTNTIELFEREIVTVSKGRHMNEIRSSGMVPFVLYGPGAEKKIHGKVKMMDVQKAIRNGGKNQNAFYDIGGDLKLKAKKMMIKDIQRHPVKRTPLHFDFYVPEAGAESEYKISVHVIGQEKSVAIKGGASLNVALHELTVKSSPVNIPEYIEVDITTLEVGDTIAIQDISKNYPKITIQGEPEDVIVKLAEPKGAAEPTAEEGAEAAAETAEGETPAAAEGDAEKKDS